MSTALVKRPDSPSRPKQSIRLECAKIHFRSVTIFSIFLHALSQPLSSPLGVLAGTYLTCYISQLDTTYIAQRTTILVRPLLSAKSHLAMLSASKTKIIGDKRFDGIGSARSAGILIFGAPSLHEIHWVATFILD